MSLANKITIIRILLVPFFIGSVAYSRMDLASVFLMLAIISDSIDGFVARVKNQKTQLGTILDPIADKLLLVSAFICLSVVKSIPPNLKFPPYVPIIVISRDAIIVLGSVIIYLIKGDLKIRPTAVGKVTTFFQMATIMSILLHFQRSYIVWNTAVILTVISGMDYIVKGSRLLNEANGSRKP